MGSLLKLVAMLAIAWVLYNYAQQQKQPQKPQARYQDPELTFSTDDPDERVISTDDCERFINADLLQSCIENKIKKAAERQSQ